MGKYKDFKIVPCVNSAYIKPLRINYKNENKIRNWDFVKSHDSVSIILYNPIRNVLIFVKQFRPAVYANICGAFKLGDQMDPSQHDTEMGITIELCAGIIDANLTPEQIAIQEIREETGYEVDVNLLELVTTYSNGVGINGSKSYMYYCEVTDDLKKYPGGGTEDEDITIIEMDPGEAEKLIDHPGPATTAGLLFAVLWFKETSENLLNKCDTCHVANIAKNYRL